MPKTVKPASELTSEEKVKRMNCFVQADPVLKFETEIVAKCIEDSTFHRFIPVKPSREKFTSSRKWAVKFYKRICDEGKFISATPQQINFQHMMETWDGEGQEEITEEGTGEGKLGGSAEGTERTDSGTDQHCEEDGSLATDESERKNSNEESRQEEMNEEQVGDEDASSTEADNQNQANTTQIPRPKKCGRRSPDESSRSSSGGAVEAEHSGMGEVALKERTKSSKKKLKTGNEQDGEQEVKQEVEQDAKLDDEQEAEKNCGL